ncbi:MAG: hypothetical protein JWM47_3338 [Acidimicrobiales bacterium]|nr:hypothetical protein [Acidimicrobiales bacterium]
MAITRSVSPTTPQGPSRRRGAVVVAVLALLVAGSAPPAGARPADRATVVVFVHGYKATSKSTDCGSAFDRMIAQLRQEGFAGTMVSVGFYARDVDCDVDLRSYGSFRDDSSWRTIAKAFSRYVHQTYTSKGIAVDVVGYSMGGLIARGAVYGGQKGEAGFWKVDIEDAVTLGTPHRGAAWYTGLCRRGQCASFKPGASDLAWLNGDGNPQGVGGTDWTTVGSLADSRVPFWSATGMANAATAEVVYQAVRHSGPRGYLANPTVIARVGVGLALDQR